MIIDYMNMALALLTIALGLFGFLAPRYTAAALDLRETSSTMGLSELRASAGGVFVALGIFCLLTNYDWAYLALGVVYSGAATGRAVSIVLDRPPMPKAAIWFLFEAIPAVCLIFFNL